MKRGIISTIAAGVMLSSVLGGLVAVKESIGAASLSTPQEIARAKAGGAATAGVKEKVKTTSTRAS